MKKINILLCILLCVLITSGCAGNSQPETPSPVSLPESQADVSHISTTTTEQTTANEDTTTSDSSTTASVASSTVTTGSQHPTTSATTTTKTKDSTTKSSGVSSPTSTTKPVGQKYATAITIETAPKKTTYHTGDTIDTTGLVLKLSFSDGSSEKITSGFNVYGFYSKTPGVKTVTVAYKHGQSTLTCTFNVTITKKQHNTPTINKTFHADKAIAVLDLLNQARKNAGIKELIMDNGELMNAAKIRAKEITIDWAHERPDHDRWDTVFDEENTHYNKRGENLAKGHTSAESVFESWKNSPGHNKNMMSPDFTHVSIACLEYNGQFYWVQLFGG